MRRLPSRCGNQLVANHQQAVIVAGHEALDQHFLADFACGLVGDHQMIAGFDIDRDALALVAVLRLDHDRCADFLHGGPGVIGIGNRSALRHRYAGCVQQPLGELLVLRDGFSDGAGAIDLGGLNAALPAAPAELHQAALREAAERNTTRGGGMHDGAGAWSETHILIEIAQLSERRGQVEGCVLDGGAAERFGELEGEAADGFLGVFDDDLENAAFDGLRDPGKRDRASGLCLKSEGGKCECMGDGNLTLVADRAHRPNVRETSAQPILEAGQPAQGALGVVAVEYRFDGGMTAPEVGTAQGSNS